MTNDDKQFFTTLIKGLEGRFDKIDSRFDKLESRFDKLETRFETLEIRFDNLESRFDKLEFRFDNLESRFDNLESRFDNFEVRFKTLESRFEGLEVKVEESSRAIRYNGLLIEKMQDDVMHIKEGDVSLMMLHEKVDYILDQVQDLPSIRQAVKNHSKRLTLLEKK